LTQAAKRAPAPILKLRRNSSNRGSIEEEKLRLDDQTPPRRTQSMGDFIRQVINKDDDNGSKENKNGRYRYYLMV
jgi:hypothetical protein